MTPEPICECIQNIFHSTVEHIRINGINLASKLTFDFDFHFTSIRPNEFLSFKN